MKEKIHAATLRSMAPGLSLRIDSATEQDLRKMLILAVDYVWRDAGVDDSALVAAVEILRSGNRPDETWRARVEASLERIDMEYLSLFKETESDRSKNARWIPAWRRYIAAEVIASACATDSKNGLLSALYACLAVQRQSDRSDLEVSILSYRGE